MRPGESNSAGREQNRRIQFSDWINVISIVVNLCSIAITISVLLK